MACEAAPAAQPQYQYVPPQVSPYGNRLMTPYGSLLRSGSVSFNPMVNYLSNLQPQLRTEATFEHLQGELVIRTATVPGASLRNTGVVDTGYSPGRFLSSPQYYFNLSSPNRTSYQTTPGTNAASSGQR